VEPRDQRAYMPGASHAEGDSEANRLHILTKGARSKTESQRLRLRTPGRAADNVVQQQQEEEAGCDPVLTKSGGPSHASSSRFKGVSWNKDRNKWQARCKGTHLGHFTTEESAARACNKYLKDGVVPRRAVSSHVEGVSWTTQSSKWRAAFKGTNLGYHATEEEAARAYSKYLKDGIDPVKHREANTSQFKGS